LEEEQEEQIGEITAETTTNEFSNEYCSVIPKP
jgi:hypothetical protein